MNPIPIFPHIDGDRPQKVAIPRPTNPITWTSSGRVSRACENCRDQKAKCSGHRPACHRCKDAGMRCSYSDRKKEKLIKELNDLTMENQTMKKILRELYPSLDGSLAQQVDQALGSDLVRSQDSSVFRLVLYDDPNHFAVDHTDEDFNRDERVQALGFVGGHSEMAWLYRLKRFLDQDSLTLGESIHSISSMNYFHDDTASPNLDSANLLVRPPHQLALKLIDDFFDAVHPTFPIIRQALFRSQCRSFYANENPRPGGMWLTILNLVFAIASKHSLVNAQPLVAKDDHQLYFERACGLGLSKMSLLDHPNLQQVQVEGLLAFYLLSTGQINRSWRATGAAIRSAVAMGLNLRNDTHSVSHVSKETRYRVWWSLFLLDTVLCVMTGRPPGTGNTFCTTPFPIPYKEEDFERDDFTQIITDNVYRTSLMNSLLSPENSVDSATTPGSNTSDLPSFSIAGSRRGSYQQPHPMTENLTPNVSLYFLYMVDLSSLLRDAIETLYAPAGSIKQSWAEIEITTSSFIKSTDSWLSRLPAEFDFTKLDPYTGDQQFARQRTSLAFRFYIIKIVITQPCLHHLAYPSSDANLSESSPLCDAMATLCIEAAYKTLDLLPNEPDITLLYGLSSWWCMLHHIMQPTTVLLIEYFTRTQPGAPEAASLAVEIQKAIRWLCAMSAYDISSQRALQVCMDILSRDISGFSLTHGSAL